MGHLRPFVDILPARAWHLICIHPPSNPPAAGQFLLRTRAKASKRSRDAKSYALTALINDVFAHRLIEAGKGGVVKVDGEEGEWGTSVEAAVGHITQHTLTKYNVQLTPLSNDAPAATNGALRVFYCALRPCLLLGRCPRGRPGLF